MLKKFYGKKGQSVSGEYAILIALVSMAIAGMTVYVKRALQGRYHDANRHISVKASSALGTAVQSEYEPYYVQTTADTQTDTLLEERMEDGVIKKVDTLDRETRSVSTQLPF